jgi:hypothetical protein
MWETLFFMQLSKRETRRPISPTSLTELGISHVKKFHTERVVLTSQGTMVLLVGFISQ